MRPLVALVLLVSGCAWTPLYRQGVGHPTFGDGREYHACVGGGACEEGWACRKGGVCEWCDADDQPSSCADGTDSED